MKVTFSSSLWRQFVWLVSLTSDNAYYDSYPSTVSGDTWKSQTINAYIPPGELYFQVIIQRELRVSHRAGPDNEPPPGVYAPVTAIDGVLTYASMTFENNTTFLGELGVAFNCSIANSSSGTPSLYVHLHPPHLGFM